MAELITIAKNFGPGAAVLLVLLFIIWKGDIEFKIRYRGSKKDDKEK